MSKEKETYKYLKLRLVPTKEQESKMLLHVNHSRGLRNILVEEGNRILDTDSEYIYRDTFRKYLKYLLNLEEYQWLREVSKGSISYLCDKLYQQYKRYFNKVSNKPKFQSKRNAKMYYYPRSDSKDKFYLDENNKLQIEKIGRVKISKGSLKSNLTKLKLIEKNDRLRQSIITFDGKYWYISISYKVSALSENQTKKELTDEVIGIDLGIKTLATCSNGKSYKNINKTKRVKTLERRLKRKQRQLLRKYEINKDYFTACLLDEKGKPKRNKSNGEVIQKNIRKTQNTIKLKQEIKLLHRKLTNIRKTYVHTITKELVEELPQEIIIEDLKVSNLMKNKYLAPSIARVTWYRFREYLTYKCKDRGILLTVANTFYPSSQLCSVCGNRKNKQNKLNLKQRIYNCECGNTLDRDYNASLNLKNYRYSNWYHENVNLKLIKTD